MSSTQSYTRFSDEKYKNWLKTTESLYIVRDRIRNFIEKETETYHNSLRNKATLNGRTCSLNCNIKKPLCKVCECWKNEIEANHKMRKSIHWDNCRPNLWSTEKWEVAKAYMPRGQKQHCDFDQFDVAAILNLMHQCTHFNIKGPCVTKVINVRNSVMHSPDLKVSNEDMNRYMETVFQFAEMLKSHAPELKNLREEIKKFNNILDKNFNQDLCQVDGQREDLQTIKDFQKVLDREQQAMRDRIEDIITRFEGKEDENDKEKSQDMNNLLDFLGQNKDLLENLGPEVDKLKDMQTKVDQHEEQITNLTGRVDQLEQLEQLVTHDPLFPDIPLKYKNHLYEHCRAKKWSEDKFPVFTEIQEPQGYKGKVTVNGQSFTGKRVFNDKKSAHQEVARIALEHLKSQDDSADEPSSSVSQPDASCSSSSDAVTPFFGKVTVDLDQEVASDRCSSNEEATEAAYKMLWECFCIGAPAEGRTYRSQVMEYFNTCCFQKPTELFVQNDDNTSTCKLKLNGPYTFYEKDGATRKRQAEQQAAKVALQHLSGILNFIPPPDDEKNFKGALKERLDALGISNPVYDTGKAQISEEEVTSSMSTDVTDFAGSISQAAVKEHSEMKSEDISTSAQLPLCQESVCETVPVLPDPQDSSSPVLKKPRIDCTGMPFFGKVTVDLNNEVTSDKCSSKEKAAETSYKVLWERFRINAPAEGQTYRSQIMEYFKTYDLQKPTEEFVDDDNVNICIVKFNGPFTFYDKDGATRKRQAEQQAAKVALQHLSGILNFAPPPDDEKNFKGVLKERLDALGISNPVYDTKECKDEISEEPTTSGISPNFSNLSISQSAVKELSEKSENISTSAQLPSCRESVNNPVPVVPQDSTSLASLSKRPKIDIPEISELLNVYNLKPPQVKVVNMKYDQNFICTVEINLEKYTCANKEGYNSKKEANRKTYMLFGCAVMILATDTDETASTGLVKQHFSKRSLALPEENCTKSENLFYYSLKNISYNVKYKGQGSSEDEAKLDALQKALRLLSPLFDYPSLKGADRPEEVQIQLTSILKGAGQKEPIISLNALKQGSVQLAFCDYTLKCTCQSTKKAARNNLSARMLGLLGVKTGATDPSLRNRVDEWFKQQDLRQPVFEDIDEGTAVKATFSVRLTCSSPDWDDSLETAKMKLLQVLKHRFQFLDDKNH